MFGAQSNLLTTNVRHHTETSQFICIANQMTGFYMMENIGRYQVKLKSFTNECSSVRQEFVKYQKKCTVILEFQIYEVFYLFVADS